MVRLKDRVRQAGAEADFAFQFHYGTIKSAIPPLLPGSIPNFNSTMVRLKVVQVHGCVL